MLGLRRAIGTARIAIRAALLTDSAYGDVAVPDDGTTEFGRLLAAYREELNWTKTQLAEHAGLDPSSVSRLEGGSRTPELATIDVLAGAMKLSPVERERLIASAGFRSEAWGDPLIVELIELLIDPTVPDETRNDLRTLVRIAVAHGRGARSYGG